MLTFFISKRGPRWLRGLFEGIVTISVLIKIGRGAWYTYTMSARSLNAGPRDVLLNFLASIGLYTLVIFLGTLVFQYINLLFPDSLVYEYLPSIRQTIRWAISVLVVVFPVYLGINTYLGRELRKFPEKRDLKTRKWLLYLTVTAAFLVIAGDMITLIYRFLQGELTARFVLKVSTVFLIAGAVFLYYGWNLKKETSAARDPRMKFFVWGVCVVVAAVIIGGFFTVGTPQQERLRQFDERRISDLQSIQWQVINYWQAKGKLPFSLEALRDDISGYRPPADPETDVSYEYRVIGDLSFELCAVFNAESYSNRAKPFERYPAKENESWTHGAGRTCFERAIDPELYLPVRKPAA